jgi:hypothetical protein
MKRARMLATLGLHMGANVSGGREAIRLDYLDPLRTRLLLPLAAPGAAEDALPPVRASIALLDEYGLSNVDMMETMVEVRFAGEGFPDFSKLVESKVKSAFTREYSRVPHKAQSLSSIGRGGKAAPAGKKPAAKKKKDSDDDDNAYGDDVGFVVGRRRRVSRRMDNTQRAVHDESRRGLHDGSSCIEIAPSASPLAAPVLRLALEAS